MEKDTKQLNKILNAVGLEERMNVNENVMNAWDDTKFKVYNSIRPRGEYIREMDEIYGFSESCILHNETGLRITYSIYESGYGGDVEFYFFEVFIITKNNERHTVQDIDIEKQLFYIKERVIPFSEIDNENLHPEIKTDFR